MTPALAWILFWFRSLLSFLNLCLWPVREVLSHCFSEYTSSLTSFLWSFWDSDNTNVGSFIVPWVPETVYFFSLFSLCFSDWVNFLVFSSSSLNLFSVLFCLVVSLSSEFYFFTVFPSYRIFVRFFFRNSICWEFPLFFSCFKRIYNWLLKHFYDFYPLKSLSGNSNIYLQD